MNTQYLAVCRYDLNTAWITLWINPTNVSNETDGSGLTNTTSSTVPSDGISEFAFRQGAANGNGMGNVVIADVVVGTTFADAAFGGAQSNTPPTISTIANLTMLPNTSTNITFTVADNEDVNGLSLTVASSNPRLFPAGSMVITGTGAIRSSRLTPASNDAGAALITISASDASYAASTSFIIKVVRPAILTLWDFDNGTLVPAVGSGTASTAGITTNSVGALAVASSDPNTGPDSRYGNFPAQGAGNKTSGAVFRVSTVGYTNIAISWDHYNISTGSKY